MPADRHREGTHAKGSCEPGQAGRCSHKQRTLVQWTILFRLPGAGRSVLAPGLQPRGFPPHFGSGPGTKDMAKQKSPPPTAPAAADPAGYTVLARRYRPRQFADLVGQEAVARALVNALKSNRVAHAYLFTGVRGVGKTSTARILAKALNCVRGPTPTPCDECDICKSIAG